jgi:hydroxymethylpyrimidine/phosphomethylpyrimidine kinase
MEIINTSKPIVLCFSELDPTGGAGLQADIETLFSIGCHACPVATALTVQNTQNASAMTPCDPALIVQQARAILEDMQVSAIKIGLVGSVGIVEVLHTLLKDYPDIPVVIDPVVVASGGVEMGSDEVVDAIRNLLLPLATLLTPNTMELRALAESGDIEDACANELLDSGCKNILLTGAHADTSNVVNKLYSLHQTITMFSWPRLDDCYHGSGCTLASACAGYIGHQVDMHDAIQQAQQFTWESLSHGTRMGFGQLIPNRSYWSKQK